MTKLIWEIVVIVLFLFLFRKPLWSALRVINSKTEMSGWRKRNGKNGRSG